MEEKPTVKVTVFTPTYNREKHIPNLYRSLCAQTDFSFEWVVVDQGQDGTEALIRRYQREAPFPVVYHRLIGERGISRAFNASLDLSSGYLHLKVDDDDMLTPDAIESVIRMEETLVDKERYAGVSGLKAYTNGQAIGSEWTLPDDWIDCTNLERYKYGLLSDKAEAYYLDVLKQYGPMAAVPGEYYTWEAVLWDRIAHAGKLIRWFNKKIYLAEYLPGGATDTYAEAQLNNFRTYTIYVSDRMTYKEVPFLMRFKLCCRYFELLRKKGLPFSAVRDSFRQSMPIAAAAYLASFFTRFIPQKPLHVEVKK